MTLGDSSLWQPWQPSREEPWNLQRVVHLHRRAAFRATWGELQRDLADGVDVSVDRVLSGTARADGMPAAFAVMAETIGNAAVAAGNPDRLKAWWVYRMLFSPDPLTERLTLMWHNHFATSNLKVDDVKLMRRQNELFRQHGRGRFETLLRSVIKDPAVLIWLDAEANRKEHPNENLARELMELFTLGEGHYTETDVKEAARCLTGWTVVRGEFRDVPVYHDDGDKVLLGQSGRFGGDDLLTVLLAQPATSRRLAWRLCDSFLGEGVASEADIDELGEGLLAHSLDIGWAVETLLRSRLFFSQRNIGTRVVSPAEFVVGAVRMLELFDSPPSTLLLAEQMSRLGQDLFYPPNVFGWREGRSWINTRSLIGRGNFAAALVAGELQSPVRPVDAHPLATRHAAANDREAVAAFFTQLIFGHEPDEALKRRLRDASDGTDNVADSLHESASAHGINGRHSGTDDNEAARRTVAALLASPAAQLC